MRIVLALAVAIPMSLACTPLAAADAVDPRPALLILGDQNVLPTGNGASWCQLLQKEQPEWNVVVNGDATRTLGELSGMVQKIVSALPHVEAVVIFTGTPDATREKYAAADASTLAKQMAQLLKRGRETAQGAKAQWVLVTPMPVVDARLDPWSRELYKGGEAAMKAIAEAHRGVAKDQGMTLVDFYQWAYDDRADGKPGRLVGSLGWAAREWAHPIMARYFLAQLRTLKMTPPDAMAFALWQKEQAAIHQMEQILKQSSEGLVAHGQFYAPKFIPGKFGSYEIELPVQQTVGDQVNLLFASSDKLYAGVGNAGNRPMFSTVLVLTVDGKEVRIALRGADWQLLDESQPNETVDRTRYRFNMQKMNYFGVTSSEEGERRWMLARFDLKPLAGQKPAAAKLIIGTPTSVEQVTPPDKVEGIPSDRFAGPQAALITGFDTQWDN